MPLTLLAFLDFIMLGNNLNSKIEREEVKIGKNSGGAKW